MIWCHVYKKSAALTGTPSFHFAFLRMKYVMRNGLLPTLAVVTRSGLYLMWLVMMNAPRISVVFPITPAQYSEQQLRAVLKPSTSCSAPKTRMFLALRAAGLSGTPAIAGRTCVAEACVPLSLKTTDEVIAEAPATSSRPASAAPANSQNRWCLFP